MAADTWRVKSHPRSTNDDHPIETRFRQDMGREIPVKEEITPPSPLTGRSPESWKTSKDDKKDEKKDKPSFRHHSKSLSCAEYGSSQISDQCEVDSDDKARKGENDLEPVSTYFTSTLIFNIYRL